MGHPDELVSLNAGLSHSLEEGGQVGLFRPAFHRIKMVLQGGEWYGADAPELQRRPATDAKEVRGWGNPAGRNVGSPDRGGVENGCRSGKEKGGRRN